MIKRNNARGAKRPRDRQGGGATMETRKKRKEEKEKKGMNLTAIDRPMPERTDQPEGGTDGDI